MGKYDNSITCTGFPTYEVRSTICGHIRIHCVSMCVFVLSFWAEHRFTCQMRERTLSLWVTEMSHIYAPCAYCNTRVLCLFGLLYRTGNQSDQLPRACSCADNNNNNTNTIQQHKHHRFVRVATKAIAMQQSKTFLLRNEPGEREKLSYVRMFMIFFGSLSLRWRSPFSIPLSLLLPMK